MPVWHVTRAPLLQTAPGPVYRVTLGLSVAYWLSGCAPLSTDEVTLSSLVRLPVAHIRPIKTAVLQALAQITPKLDQEWQNADRLHKIQMANAAHAYEVQTRRRALANAAQTAKQPITSLPVRLDTPHSAHHTDSNATVSLHSTLNLHATSAHERETNATTLSPNKRPTTQQKPQTSAKNGPKFTD